MNWPSRPRTTRRSGRFSVVVTLVVAWMVAIPAAGQSDLGVKLPPGFDEVLRPDFVRRDLQVMTSTLGLDAVQQSILEQLFLDYEMMVGAGNAAIQEEIRERTSELIAEQLSEQRVRQERYRTQMRALVQEVRDRQKKSKDPAKAQTLRDEFRRRAEQLRGEMQQPSASASVRVTREFFDTIEQWRLDKTALGDSLLAGIRAILTEEQAELWPGLERQLARQKRLGQGQLAGESLDLFTLLEEIGVDDVTRVALRAELREYELALDQALRQRTRRLAETRRTLMDAILAGDDRQINAAIDRQIETHLTVRQVNDRYLEVLIAAMPPEDGARLLEAARRRAYSRLFTPTRGRRALAGALELTDLAPDHRRAIEQLAAAHRDEMEATSLELIRRHRDQEQAKLSDSIRKRWSIAVRRTNRNRNAVDQGTNELLGRRRSFDLGTIQQLRTHLTARQAERVLGPSERQQPGEGRP